MTEYHPVIVCDPRISFGRPRIPNTGVRAEILAEHVWAGDSVDEMVADYEVHRLDVLWACAWWVDECGGLQRMRGVRRARWQRWSLHAYRVLGGHVKDVVLCDPDDYEAEGL